MTPELSAALRFGAIALSGLGLLLMAAPGAAATRLKTDSFIAYRLDLNGDGEQDVYLKANPRFVPVDVDDFDVPMVYYDANSLKIDGRTKVVAEWNQSVDVSGRTPMLALFEPHDFNNDGVADLLLTDASNDQLTVRYKLLGSPNANTPSLLAYSSEDIWYNWHEVVTNSFKVGTELVFEVDQQRLKKVRLFETDPFWFKYYASFWKNGNYRPGADVGYGQKSDCQGADWLGAYATVAFGSNSGNYVYRGTGNSIPSAYAAGPYYGVRGCYISYIKNSNSVDQVFFDNQYKRKYGNWLPGSSSLGPNYYLVNPNFTSDGAITMNFGINLNERVVLKSSTNQVTGAEYWRRVSVGQVTREGWGVVPLSDSAQNNVKWAFVIPSNKTLQGIASCRPGDCIAEPLVHGGPVKIYSPPLWGPSDAELIRRLLDKGASFGGAFDYALADGDLSQDRAREGLYSVVRGADGRYYLDSTFKKDAMSAGQLGADGKPIRLFINGSGNNIVSALTNAMLVAKEFSLPQMYFYYMPQEAGLNAYASAVNLRLRQFLQDLDVASQQSAAGWVNIMTHSWAGYVTTSECGKARYHCANINHISFAPATLDTFWPGMLDGYNKMQGRTTAVIGSKDILSVATWGGSGAKSNNHGNIEGHLHDVKHPLADILVDDDFSELLR